MSILRCFILAIVVPPLAGTAQTLYTPGGTVGNVGGSNVGIGTSAPSRKLEISGAGSVYSKVTSTNSYDAAMHFSSAGADAYIGRLPTSGGGNGTLDFFNSGLRMVIDATGNVGVGTVSPSARLEVIGGSRPFGLIVEGDGVNASARIALRRANDPSATGNIDWIGSSNSVGARIGVNDNIVGAMQFKLGGAAQSDTKAIITSQGNFGLGIINPVARLHVYQANGVANQLCLETGFNGGNAFALNSFILGVSNGGFELRDLTNNTSRLVVQQSTGNIGIGTTNPTQKLSVNGTVRAREVIVENTGWADYVFDEGYPLSTLSEVERHIKSEKHLPGIPSASEVAEHGISVGEMQAKLLSKIEELTLHVIAQEKRAQRQEERIAKLEAEKSAASERQYRSSQ